MNPVTAREKERRGSVKWKSRGFGSGMGCCMYAHVRASGCVRKYWEYFLYIIATSCFDRTYNQAWILTPRTNKNEITIIYWLLWDPNPNVRSKLSVYPASASIYQDFY